MIGRPATYCATCGEYIREQPKIIGGHLRMGYIHVSETGAEIYRNHRATKAPETDSPENRKE